MRLNKHSEIEGRHAFLSASKYAWIRYDADKLAASYRTAVAAARGTRLHALAAELIAVGQKLPRSTTSFNQYVNDAIGFTMQPEVPLKASENAFGTADALSFRNNFLRIHDLKTGIGEAKFDQLIIYAAFFCIEYNFKPSDIKIELRIYQNDTVSILEPERDDLMHVIDKIIVFDKIIDDIRNREAM